MEQCHPVGNPDWFDCKHLYFGGDDGMEFIEAERLIPSFDRNFCATHLNLQLSQSEISISLVTR